VAPVPLLFSSGKPHPKKEKGSDRWQYDFVKQKMNPLILLFPRPIYHRTPHEKEKEKRKEENP
jgi:hypothetical protein